MTDPATHESDGSRSEKVDLNEEDTEEGENTEMLQTTNVGIADAGDEGSATEPPSTLHDTDDHDEELNAPERSATETATTNDPAPHESDGSRSEKVDLEAEDTEEEEDTEAASTPPQDAAENLLDISPHALFAARDNVLFPQVAIQHPIMGMSLTKIAERMARGTINPLDIENIKRIGEKLIARGKATATCYENAYNKEPPLLDVVFDVPKFDEDQKLEQAKKKKSGKKVTPPKVSDAYMEQIGKFDKAMKKRVAFEVELHSRMKGKPVTWAGKTYFLYPNSSFNEYNAKLDTSFVEICVSIIVYEGYVQLLHMFICCR